MCKKTLVTKLYYKLNIDMQPYVYAADFTVSLLDHGRNAKESEIGSWPYIVQSTCVDLIIIIIINNVSSSLSH